MKISVSNIAWSEEYDVQMYEWLNENGIDGLEIAPTRIIKEAPYSNIKTAAKWAEELSEKYGLEVPSMQSIWFGRSEKIFGGAEERAALVEYTKKAIDFASVIGCKNLVFGCPRNRSSEDYEKDIVIARAFFKELGEYARANNTVVAMEANPSIYNTNFINTTAQAIELVKEVSSEGFKLNLDFGTVVYNGEDLGILSENLELINHVHISEPYLAKVEKRAEHNELCELLRKGYKGYVSLEMKNLEDLELVKESVLYVAEVFNG